MTRFLKAVRTSNVTSDQSVVEILAAAKGCRVFAAYVTVVTAVAGVLGFGRPAAAGITPTTPLTFPSIDGVGDFSLSRTALAWGTSPTAPSNFMDRRAFPATVGSQATVIFTGGIFVPAGATFVAHNILGGPTYDITLEVGE